VLDEPPGDARTHEGTEGEDASEAAEYRGARARGGTVAEVGGGSRLEGGPPSEETFDDGSKEKEVVSIFGEGGCGCGYDDEHEVSGKNG